MYKIVSAFVLFRNVFRRAMEELRIIFMGTPEFAVPSLEILVENKYNVVAVVTAPDKPKGRGQKMGFSPVKESALNHGIPVLQPTNLKDAGFLTELKTFSANLQVVVAFRMLPEAVWSMPSLGTFNLHASLLPEYRGAAPIHWAVINGEKVTGVTTFFLEHQIDTGRIILQEKETIYDDDTTGSLYGRLMIKGAELVLRTLKSIEGGKASTKVQRDSPAVKHAPKIFKEMCEINWHQSAANVRNFVRGLNPNPAAWCSLSRKVFKIFEVSLPDKPESQNEPGAIDTDNKSYLYIKTQAGWISIDELQPEGKRRMRIHEFFKGNKI